MLFHASVFPYPSEQDPAKPDLRKIAIPLSDAFDFLTGKTLHVTRIVIRNGVLVLELDDEINLEQYNLIIAGEELDKIKASLIKTSEIDETLPTPKSHRFKSFFPSLFPGKK
jgi:hypothetical protein